MRIPSIISASVTQEKQQYQQNKAKDCATYFVGLSLIIQPGTEAGNVQQSRQWGAGRGMRNKQVGSQKLWLQLF